MTTLVQIVQMFVNVLIFAIFARSILTWFPIDRGGPIFQALDAITEPIMQPLRRIVPLIGMIDITPMGAIVMLYIISYALGQSSSRCPPDKRLRELVLEESTRLFGPDAIDRNDLFSRRVARHHSHGPTRDAEAVGQQPRERLVRPAIDRRRRHPDLERIAQEPSDFGPSRPGAQPDIESGRRHLRIVG